MIKTKQLNWLLIITLPLCFYINGTVFLMNLALQLFLIFKSSKNWDSFIFVAVLWSFLFSGVSFFGIRLYDIFLLVGLARLLSKQKIKIAVSYGMGVLYFAVCVFLIFFTKIDADSLLELSRYIFCFGYFFMFSNLRMENLEVKSQLQEICVTNIYYAVAVYFQIAAGLFRNIKIGSIFSDVYIYGSEVRMNGFFTDPNKYMTFCTALLFLVELFLRDRKKLISISIIVVSLFLSFSRTAVLFVMVYCALKLLVWIRGKGKQLYVFTVISLIIVAVLSVAFKEQIVNLINGMYAFSANILGRQHTLEVNPTLAEDNRVFVWTLAFEHIKERWLLGNGFLSYETLLPFPTHNTFVSLLLDGGVVLLFSFLFMIRKLIFSYRYDLMISIILLPMMVLDLGNYRIIYLLMGIWSIYEASRRKNCEEDCSCNKKIRR